MRKQYAGARAPAPKGDSEMRQLGCAAGLACALAILYKEDSSSGAREMTGTHAAGLQLRRSTACRPLPSCRCHGQGCRGLLPGSHPLH